uniref:Uncharacterized protein n=1 Tax=Ciona savignyi TaxID=51511 RepID=H2Y953_CIOSA
MLQRRGWLGGPKPPKNPHSLEHLKYLHHVLMKNQTVTESNKSLIVEALRSMAEILIWGDQNDSSVFEFYLEKNMFLFFLNILEQNSGNYVCVQLLQTLNILFENLQHETSLYYLLSNNHINEVICHKFDFSDEEVMAYYISFLKTLSLRLNQHTIHFFYNEHTDDFALYTEAIKFFNHPESMVRIAVRTLTLNVYNGISCDQTALHPTVNDRAMLRFIRDKTAAPYFSNLVWFIAEHVREVDNCVRNNANHQHRDRLRDLVAEHLDHLHYLNDIVTLENEMLNEVLIHHLLHRLFLPLYVRSLADGSPGDDNRPLVSSVVALFLLSQVFLIIHHKPLVHQLAEVIFNRNLDSLSLDGEGTVIHTQTSVLFCFHLYHHFRHISAFKHYCTFFTLFLNFLEQKLEMMLKRNPLVNLSTHNIQYFCYVFPGQEQCRCFQFICRIKSKDYEYSCRQVTIQCCNKTINSPHLPFLDTIYSALNCTGSDYSALFALCFLYAILHNKGLLSLKKIVELGLVGKEEGSESYCHWLIERLLRIISKSVIAEAMQNLQKYLKNFAGKIHYFQHASCVKLVLAFLQQDNVFDTYTTPPQNKPLNVEYLMMDSSLLLPPTVTPLTGIEFSKRLPCGQSEQARQLIGIFFTLRDLSLFLCKESETQLPLTREQDCIQTNDKLDLSKLVDLIACTVSSKESKQRRFLVVELYQLILVEPDSKRLGWGVVKFAGFLQVLTRIDSRTLHVIIHKPSGLRRVPILAANFIFDDHIRCMAAKQRLTKGRMRARHLKTGRIAVLL